MRPRPAAAAALLALLVPLAAPAEAAFVQSGTILGGTTAFAGWTQEGPASALDAGKPPQGAWDIVRFWTALGTDQGGTAPVTASNQLRHVYYRLDHNATGTQGEVPDINWNLQLNLGAAPPGKVDHLLQIRITAPGVASVRLYHYTTTPYPDLGAFTTNQFTTRFSNLVTDGVALFKDGIQVRTGKWDATRYGWEVAIPVAWFQDATLSTVRADGSGGDYISGALFSSTGSFGSVGTPKDELNDASGAILVMGTSLRTGASTFEKATARRLAFLVQPSDGRVGSALPAFSVEVLDVAGVRVPTTHSVSLALHTDPTGGAAALGGTRTVSAVAGVATFTGITLSAPAAGYRLKATAAGLVDGNSSAFTVTDPVVAIAVAAAPVDASGAAQPGSLWGAWSAVPGATDVAATNYLKVTNTGEVDATAVTVDFTPTAFAGASDPDWTVGIDGNVRFACATTLAGQAPSALAFAFADPSPTGSVTCAFPAGSSGGAGTMYVAYRLAAIPAVAQAQDYQASFTVSGDG